MLGAEPVDDGTHGRMRADQREDVGVFDRMVHVQERATLPAQGADAAVVLDHRHSGDPLGDLAGAARPRRQAIERLAHASQLLQVVGMVE